MLFPLNAFNVTTSDLPDETKCAEYLKAVGDPLRIRIVRALQVGPLSVSDIAEVLEHEVGGVSHHLRVLYHAGIVQTKREGKYVYYSLSDQLIDGGKRGKHDSLNFGCCRLDVGRSSSD